MKTKNKIFLLILASFLLLGSQVYAEENVDTSNTAVKATSSLQMKKQEEAKRLLEKKNDTQEKRADVKDLIKDKRASSTQIKTENVEKRQEKLDEVRANIQARMKEFVDRIIKRLEAAVERVVKLVERINSRIVKLKEEGIDTLKAEEYIANAKTDATEATAIIAKIPTALETALTSEKMRGSFEEVRKLVTDAQKEIRSSYENIRKAVDSLKNILKQRSDKATTTSTQN